MAETIIQCAPIKGGDGHSEKPNKVMPPRNEQEAKEQVRALMKKHAGLMRALAES